MVKNNKLWLYRKERKIIRKIIKTKSFMALKRMDNNTPERYGCDFNDFRILIIIHL